MINKSLITIKNKMAKVNKTEVVLLEFGVHDLAPRYFVKLLPLPSEGFFAVSNHEGLGLKNELVFGKEIEVKIVNDRGFFVFAKLFLKNQMPMLSINGAWQSEPKSSFTINLT